MRRSALHRLVLSLALFITGVSAFAQERVSMKGRLVDQDEMPIPGAYVYAFSTCDEADIENDIASEQLKSTKYQPKAIPLSYSVTNYRGEYSLELNPESGLLFIAPNGKTHVEYLNKRSFIYVTMDMREEIINDDPVIDSLPPKLPEGELAEIGGWFYVQNKPYAFDKDMLGEVKSVTRTNSRLIVQVFLMNHAGTEKIYYKPRVIDGEEYHRTQKLYNSTDPLTAIAERLPLTEDKDTLMFNHKFQKPNSDDEYYCMANIILLDYNGEYYHDTIQLLNTARVPRPFQLLDYSFGYGRLSHEDHKRNPIPNPVLVPRDMRLKFGVNSPRLNMSDRETVAVLDSLKTELKKVCANPSVVLDSLSFYGYSSPEGRYRRNLELSRQRTNTVKNAVLASLPVKSISQGVLSNGEVVSWEKVAEILEADSLLDEAMAIRKIIEQHPNDIDARSKQIVKLKNYKGKILPVLEQLRVVRCVYKYNEFRARKVNEIWELYNKDPYFESGVDDFTLYDYWHLFKLVEDKKSLEILYRRALDKSRLEEGRVQWVLPANNLAVMMLEKGQADTTLLAPFISYYHRLNAVNARGQEVNNEAVVTNQVMMCLAEGDFKKAEMLSSLLEKANPTLRAIVRCLGGYINLTKKEDRESLELIRASSRRNRVIMNMYAKKCGEETAKMLSVLPNDDPVILYLKAQRICMDKSNHLPYLQSQYFDRSLDPYFEHPLDAWTDAATEDEMGRQQEVVKKWEDKVMEYQRYGYANTLKWCQDSLAAAKVKLDRMKTGEDREFVKYNDKITAYEAAKIYLAKCVKLDEKFIVMARRDGNINEELFNDIMGIKKEEKK